MTFLEPMGAASGLWLAVVGSGLYHGLNPGMGWPLAVAAAMLERRSRVLWTALGLLAFGHLIAMLVAILPFAFLSALIAWQREVQVGASLLVIGFGLYLLVSRRHPRMLARIRPAALGLWSFAVALAHGAGFMLVPIYLGLCGRAGLMPAAATVETIVTANLGMALLVSAVHTAAMAAAGASMAWLAYRSVGLQLVSKSWLNVEVLWALSLILVGAVSLAFAWPFTWPSTV